jgi:hypothetical protein
MDNAYSEQPLHQMSVSYSIVFYQVATHANVSLGFVACTKNFQTLLKKAEAVSTQIQQHKYWESAHVGDRKQHHTVELIFHYQSNRVLSLNRNKK